MEVPSEVLEKLVCERCSGYLSRGPVHLLEDGKYRCGRCPWTEDDEEEGIRVEASEELAKFMCFPCKYQENGCTSTVRFTDNERHEQACPYREYLCPLAESEQCEWTGYTTATLEHCQQDHPTKVVEKPYKRSYAITRDILNNYILFSSEVLFLLQFKVCTATRNIYHAVRFIGDPARASDFKYTLDIKNNHGRLTKYGTVTARDLRVLQEDSCEVMGVNSVQEFLDDFKNTTFGVTIDTLDHVTPPVTVTGVTVSCGECAMETEPLYRGDWMCKEHAPKQRTCKNSTRGCTYSDISKKCAKHEWYYCQYSAYCFICTKTFTGMTLDQHYTQYHGDITHGAGTVCTVSPVASNEPLIIDSNFGKAVCE